MNRMLIIAVALLLVIATGAAAYLTRTPAPSGGGAATSTPASFDEVGVVTKDNPGQKPGVWYLVYEKPGAPALSVELDLNSVPSPYIDIAQGERKHVVGTREGSLVIVSSIEAAP